MVFADGVHQPAVPAARADAGDMARTPNGTTQHTSANAAISPRTSWLRDVARRRTTMPAPLPEACRAGTHPPPLPPTTSAEAESGHPPFAFGRLARPASLLLLRSDIPTLLNSMVPTSQPTSGTSISAWQTHPTCTPSTFCDIPAYDAPVTMPTVPSQAAHTSHGRHRDLCDEWPGQTTTKNGMHATRRRV